MTGELLKQEASVPIDGGKDVTISPGSPWPSTYRGSKYSLVESRKRKRDKVIQWKYYELQAYALPPIGLVRALQSVGKSLSTGKGSFRVTTGGEVLTKVYADSYDRAHNAPHTTGWIPVYLGQLSGGMGFDKINNDPGGGHPAIWEGFPFNHGERWVVGANNRLVWKHGQYRFESVFDHPELVETYQQYRNVAGRLYINEYGHVRVNVPADQVPDSRREEVLDIYTKWREQAEREENNAALRLVTQRLKATSPDNDPMNGHMPIYIGHLNDFDNGLIPRPVVTDSAYFASSSQRGTKVVGD